MGLTVCLYAPNESHLTGVTGVPVYVAPVLLPCIFFETGFIWRPLYLLIVVFFSCAFYQPLYASFLGGISRAASSSTHSCIDLAFLHNLHLFRAAFLRAFGFSRTTSCIAFGFTRHVRLSFGFAFYVIMHRILRLFASRTAPSLHRTLLHGASHIAALASSSCACAPSPRCEPHLSWVSFCIVVYFGPLRLLLLTQAI